jgi:hypothetical protein
MQAACDDGGGCVHHAGIAARLDPDAPSSPFA